MSPRFGKRASSRPTFTDRIPSRYGQPPTGHRRSHRRPLVLIVLAALAAAAVTPIAGASAATIPAPPKSHPSGAQAAPAPVPTSGPLVLAPGTRRTELAHTAHVGQTIPLRAAVSGLPGLRHPRLSAEAQTALAGARWKLVQRPANSRAAVTAARGIESTFRPDVPGTYRLELSLEWRRRTWTATLTLTVTEPGPLVPLNTIDYDTSGKPGVVVGSQRYAIPSGGDIQVVALNRLTLALLGNRAFPATSVGISSMDTFVRGFDATALVIVTNPAGTTSAGGFSPVQKADVGALNTTLGRIGGAFPGNWFIGGSSEQSCWSGWQQYCYATAGWSGPAYPATLSSFSVAGVPGMALGEAWRDTAVQRGQRDGRITGYLTASSSVDDPDGPNPYTVVRGADGAVTVDTCVSGGPAACVIQVGGQSFTPPAGDGLFVLQLDRTTLAPLRQSTVTTATDLQTELAQVMLPNSRPGHLLVPGVDDQRVFIIQSVGSGRLTGASSAVLQPLDQIGATLEAITASVINGHPYSAIGVADDLPWSGSATESSPVIRAGQTGTQRVALVRERDGRVTPKVGDPRGMTNLELYDIIFQPATPWSFAGSPVLPYVAGVLALPADVRSAYPNRGLDFASKLALLVSMTCPADHDARGFSCDDFTAVQNELKIEFDGVQSVRGLLDAIKQPFLLSAQTQQYAVQQIADEIEASLQPPPTASSSWGWLDQFTTAMWISSYVATLAGQDEAATVFGLLATVASLATTLMASDTGDAVDDVDSAANDLSSELADQSLAQLEAIGLIELILVADQGKLLTVRDKTGTDPAWTWTQQTANNAVSALNAAARAETYAALMPLSWPLWDIQPTSPGQTSPSTAATVCVGEGGDNDHFTYQPFLHAVPANQFQAITTWNTSGLTTQLWTFARMSRVDSWWDNNPQHNTTLPSTSLTDKIFATSGDGAYQYAPRWFRQTYNPPGRAVCVPSGQSNSFLKLPARADVGPSDVMVR